MIFGTPFGKVIGSLTSRSKGKRNHFSPIHLLYTITPSRDSQESEVSVKQLPILKGAYAYRLVNLAGSIGLRKRLRNSEFDPASNQ